MKIACIGNSHLASLKQGWDVISDEYEAELVFFGQRNKGMRDLGSDGRILVPKTDELRAALRFTSGAYDHIDTDEYDAFLLYAMWLPALLCDPDAFYSEKVLKQAVADLVADTLSLYVLGLLPELSGKPVLVGHNPLQTSGTDDAAKASLQDLARYQRGAELLEKYFLKPKGARLQRQPEQTIAAGCQTFQRYSKGSRRLSIGDQMDGLEHGEKDPYHHMNGEFGAIFLRQMLSDLGAQKKAAR